MRILVAHNFYNSAAPSGEDFVYRAEVELLRAHGHQVVTFERHNDGLAALGRLALAGRAGSACVWSRASQRELADLLAATRPQIAHFHNTFPLISPAAFYACRAAGVPVVHTLHNYRLACANGLFFRDGRPCEACLSGGRQQALLAGCYRGSRLQTIPVVTMQIVHERLGTYRRTVQALLAPTEFARQKLVQSGVPRELIHVKPNFLATENLPAAEAAGDYLIFVGRLSFTKGITTLLEAARLFPDLPIRVVGDGPAGDEVRRAAGRRFLWLGKQPHRRVLELIAGARALVMPSLCYETFGRSAMEAFALGRPVIASDLGAMAELVAHRQTGLLFPPGDAAALAACGRELMADPDLALHLGRRAQKSFKRNFTGERNHERLLRLYQRLATNAVGFSTTGSEAPPAVASPEPIALTAGGELPGQRGERR